MQVIDIAGLGAKVPTICVFLLAPQIPFPSYSTINLLYKQCYKCFPLYILVTLTLSI